MNRPSPTLSRRHFLRTSAAALAGAPFLQPGSVRADDFHAIPLGERPTQAAGLEILNPRGRVPASFIIDDSTCLVNMGKFCMPQFAEAWPEREEYKKPWRSWPDEIPDSFVRTFAEWCADRGVKGKYSIVPYPAMVGWVDRELPGWSRAELRDSVAYVRDVMSANWDIHPEMITHTRIIDTKTGRAMPRKDDGSYWMENGGWTPGKSVDELANYIAYALNILKNAGFHCDGATTPGGFGNGAIENLSLAMGEAIRSVYKVDLPHYFKYLELDKAGSTAPRVEHVSGLKAGDPQAIVNVLGGSGDWFGGWDGASAGDVADSVDKFITADASAGRMVEMIEKGEPAVFLCHWAGLYHNGDLTGFHIFQQVVDRVIATYESRLHWMKLSEIARYQAARELTAIEALETGFKLEAPYSCPNFTIQVPVGPGKAPKLCIGPEKRPVALREVNSPALLTTNTWHRDHNDASVCFNLPKGEIFIAAN
jgi:hypothetical protein